eukprot:scaffold26933_cov21-Tisochrysis_lutea.AAC.1
MIAERLGSRPSAASRVNHSQPANQSTIYNDYAVAPPVKVGHTRDNARGGYPSMFTTWEI